MACPPDHARTCTAGGGTTPFPGFSLRSKAHSPPYDHPIARRADCGSGDHCTHRRSNTLLGALEPETDGIALWKVPNAADLAELTVIGDEVWLTE